MIQSELLRNLKGYIGGAWVEADTGDTLAVTNPVDDSELARIPAMGRAETLRAVQAARESLAHPATIEQRARWLAALADGLRERREEIGRILTSEHGKPLQEGQGEVDYAAGFFQFCADNCHHLASRTLEEKPKDLTWQVHYRPAGVVGLITPWNFPIGMIAKKLSAALAADCACIIKPSSKTPLTMIALFEVMDRVLDLPPGKVNLVSGPAGEITDALFDAPEVRLVSFTGSTSVGKDLIRKSAPGIKRLTLELGGNAPFIVFDDADLKAAADNLMGNKFRGGGQTCVCANRVFVQRGVAEAFAEAVASRVQRLRVGDGLQEGTDIGPLIDSNAVAKVRRHTEDALGRGARRVTQGEAPAGGSFYPPTVLLDVPRDAACFSEETFGPLVPMITFDHEAEVVEAANDTEFGLAAYLFTADTERAERVVAGLQFAHAAINTGSGPTPEAPFGGMKQSGFGREGGLEGLFEFTEVQTVPRA